MNPDEFPQWDEHVDNTWNPEAFHFGCCFWTVISLMVATVVWIAYDMGYFQ